MSIDREQITHIARLARLKTDPEKSAYYATQINPVMDLVEQMNRIDTSGIEPMAHPQDRTLRLREDVVTEEDQRGNFQAVAPSVEAGFYLVPKVIE